MPDEQEVPAENMSCDGQEATEDSHGFTAQVSIVGLHLMEDLNRKEEDTLQIMVLGRQQFFCDYSHLG